MRVGLAIAIATLLLGLASLPMHGQTRADNAPALESIHMIDSQTGWATTDRRFDVRVLRTINGENHWREITPLDSSGKRIRVDRMTVFSSQVAWVSSVDSSDSKTSEIFRTTDGGRTWRSARIPAPSITAISFINPREGWLLASWGAAMLKEDVEIYHSTDGGETWIALVRAMGVPYGKNNGLPFVGDKSSITFSSSATGWITGIDLQYNSLYLYASRNGGRMWRPQHVPIPNALTRRWTAFPQPPKFFTAQDGILPILYSLYNNSGRETGKVVVLYATHDGGTMWAYKTSLRISVSDAVHQAVSDMNHAWVTNGRTLRATSDGGRRWATMSPNRLFADVKQLDFISPQVGWAIRETFPFLLKTMDGGRNWTPMTYTILRQ